MRRLLVFGLFFLTGLTAMAQPPVKVASIEGVTEYRLANGARVLLFPEMSRPTGWCLRARGVWPISMLAI